MGFDVTEMAVLVRVWVNFLGEDERDGFMVEMDQTRRDTASSSRRWQ